MAFLANSWSSEGTFCSDCWGHWLPASCVEGSGETARAGCKITDPAGSAQGGALRAGPTGSAQGGAPGRARPQGGASGALPVPGFRVRVPEEDRRAIGGAAARRDFQTRTMASCWWRWRHGCSWRPAARSPGPGFPGRAGPCGPRPAAAAARAQVRPGSARRSGRRGHGAMTAAAWNEWASGARVPGGGPRWDGTRGCRRAGTRGGVGAGRQSVCL